MKSECEKLAVKPKDDVRKIDCLSETAKLALDRAGVKTADQLQKLTYDEIEKLECSSSDKEMVDYVASMLLDVWQPNLWYAGFGMERGSRGEVRKILYSLSALKSESFERINNKENDLGCWATVDELIVALVGAIKVAWRGKKFYSGIERGEINQLLAKELSKKNGLVRVWMRIRNNPDLICNKYITDRQIEIVALSTQLLGDFLWDILNPETEFSTIPSGETIFSAVGALRKGDTNTNIHRKALTDAIDQYIWDIIDVNYDLYLLEYKIWKMHPEWKPFSSGFSWGGEAEWRIAIDNHCSAIEKFNNEHPCAISHLRSAISGLSNYADDAPLPFCGTRVFGMAMPYERDVLECLAMPYQICWEDPSVAPDENDEQSDSEHVGIWIAEKRREFLNALHLHFIERANKSHGDSLARRYWFEADAELLGHQSFTQPVMSKEDAARIIEWAKKAAREQWVDAQVRSSRQQTPDVVFSLDSTSGTGEKSRPEPIEVRLVGDQLQELVDGRMVKTAKLPKGLAKGKGISKSPYVGCSYKGIELVDETHLRVYGTTLCITAAGNWPVIDRMIDAHFADKDFTISDAEWRNFSTADEKKLLKCIRRQTFVEAGLKRRGNCKYTELACFEDPKHPQIIKWAENR